MMLTAREMLFLMPCSGLGFLFSACGSPIEPEPIEVLQEEGLHCFEAQIDSLRVELKIPGMAAAIAVDGEIVWSRGFGYADAYGARPAADTTAFYLASVTKPYAAVIVMQLVEEGVLSLDDPVGQYGVNLVSDGVIRVRHLLSHTSEGIPGSEHHYNGQRYLELDKVIEGASGRTLAELLVERVIEPLALRHTAPSIWDTEDFAVTGYDAQEFYDNMARGYRLEGSKVIPERHPEIFCSSAGLLSSVRDVASFSIAIDQDRLLDPETKERMLSRTVSNSGHPLPYGLGWYVQYHRGLKLEWHGGEWNAQSALLLRVPERRMTFVAAANTRRMSGAYRMGLGDVMESGVARLFMNAFVFGDEPLPD